MMYVDVCLACYSFDKDLKAVEFMYVDVIYREFQHFSNLENYFEVSLSSPLSIL